MSQHKNNPQLEDGFTRIANELLEAISTFGFSQRELSVLLAIIRKTYGYGKKTDDMSASQLTALCNVPRQHVTTTLLSLANRNVISKIPGRFGSIIGIQKITKNGSPKTFLKVVLLVLNWDRGVLKQDRVTNAMEIPRIRPMIIWKLRRNPRYYWIPLVPYRDTLVLNWDMSQIGYLLVLNWDTQKKTNKRKKYICREVPTSSKF